MKNINWRALYTNTIGKSMILTITSAVLILIPLITPTYYGLTREGSRYMMFVWFSWIGGLVTLRELLTHKQRSRLFNVFSSLILLYISVVFISDVTGLDFATSILGSAWRHQGYVLLLSCVIFLNSVRYLYAVCKNFFTHMETAITLSHICVLVWAASDGLKKIMGMPVELFNGRLANPIGNPNSLAGYLVMTFPFVMLHKRIPIHVKAIILLLNAGVIWGTESRSGLLALGVIVLALSFHSRKNILLFATVPLVILLLINTPSASYIKRYSIWDNQVIIWSEGIKAVVKKPILGFGQENFELIFPQNRMMKVDNAHNIFLETAVSSGLLGLGIFIGVLLYAFRDASFVVRLGLLAFLIRAQFNPLSIVEIVYFWLYLGMSTKKLKPDSR